MEDLLIEIQQQQSEQIQQNNSEHINSKTMAQNYISQQLKNTSQRRKNDRRISSILSQIRYSSFMDQQQTNNGIKMSQLQLIQNQFKINGGQSKRQQINSNGRIEFAGDGSNKIVRKKRRQSNFGRRASQASQLSFNSQSTLNNNDGNYDNGLKKINSKGKNNRISLFGPLNLKIQQNKKGKQNRWEQNNQSTNRTSEGKIQFKIKKKNKRPNLSHLVQQKSNEQGIQTNRRNLTLQQRPVIQRLQFFPKFPAKQSQSQIESPQYFQPSNANASLLHRPLNMNSKLNSQSHQPSSLQPVNLGSQNIHKLNSFIRGAYQNETVQLSPVVNLKLIDRYRRDFYTFDKMYSQMVQSNIQNRMTLKDVKQQNFRDIVYVNQLKNHATAPQFLVVMNQLKIIR